MCQFYDMCNSLLKYWTDGYKLTDTDYLVDVSLIYNLTVLLDFLIYNSTAPSTVNKDCDFDHKFNTTNYDTESFNGLSNGEEPFISVRCYYHIIVYTWTVW